MYTRRAEEKGNTGFSVLAKLHYGVVELLSDATSAIQSGTGEGKTISSRFLVCMQCMVVSRLFALFDEYTHASWWKP